MASLSDAAMDKDSAFRPTYHSSKVCCLSGHIGWKNILYVDRVKHPKWQKNPLKNASQEAPGRV
jgi:hypothetical protein